MVKKNCTKDCNEQWEFKYLPKPSAPIYWPGGKDLKKLRDEPECGFDGKSHKCADKKDLEGMLVLLVWRFLRRGAPFLISYVCLSSSVCLSVTLFCMGNPYLCF